MLKLSIIYFLLKFTLMKNAKTSTTIGFVKSNKVENLINAMKFAPSEFQENVFCAVDSTDKNLVISAVAGSGKTTTIVELLDLILDKNVLFLAFNKEIQEVIFKKVTAKNLSNVAVKTCHAFGLSQLRNAFGRNIKDIDANKYSKLLRRLIAYAKSGDVSGLKEYSFSAEILSKAKFSFVLDEKIDEMEFVNRVKKLSDLVRANLVSDLIELNAVAEKHEIECVGNECQFALDLVAIASEYIRYIDYSDMIFLPLHKGVKIDTFDVVVIDECQDLNNAQRTLMLKASAKGRFIAVGDKAQAIYGFAGADTESFNKLMNSDNTINLPLSYCYRCGSNIIDLAKQYMPSIIAHSSTGEGVVNNNAKLEDINEGDMVLCRNTAPLVKLCMKYLQVGKKAVIKGQDIAKGIIKTIENTFKVSSIEVLEVLEQEKSILLQSIMQKNKCTQTDAEENSVYVAFLDRCMVVSYLAEMCQTASDMVGMLQRIFSDDNTTGIQLSTIHRSKGLEADNVFIVCRELMPSKYAKQEWQMEQENNLTYVAYTRAKKLLGFVTDFNPNDKVEAFSQKVNVYISKFIGTIGEKISFVGTIQDIKSFQSKFGQTEVYRITDTYGNLWVKWGVLDTRLIISGERSPKVGTKIQATALLKEHKQFRGENQNVIKSLSKYEPKVDISLYID